MLLELATISLGDIYAHTVSIHMTETREEIFQIGQQLCSYLQTAPFPLRSWLLLCADFSEARAVVVSCGWEYFDWAAIGTTASTAKEAPARIQLLS
jgi:hypothetical protein